MKIFDLIQFTESGSKAICQNCMHFENDPALIEKAYPGLTIMSSGYASVRDKDGLCNYNQLYLSARDSCPHYTKKTKEIIKDEAW